MRKIVTTPALKLTYESWLGMRGRCHRPTHPDYPEYGGRGVVVCDRWRKSFLDFVADLGERPSKAHSIDRYPNNRGNYEPGNVRWATPREQAQNKSNSLPPITHDGVTKPLVEWARQFNLSPGVLKYRLDVKKMSFEDATTTPLGKRPITVEYQGRRWTAKELATHTGLPYATVCNRLNLGWTVERVVSTPNRTVETHPEHRRTVYRIEHDGKTLSINKWAKHFNVHPAALYYRIVVKHEDLVTAVTHLTKS